MAAGADFRSRIIVEGAQQATAEIKQFGTAGEQAFNQVDKGTKTATQSLRAFTKETTGMRKASGQLFKNFSDMGRSLETVGGLLGSTLGGVAGGLIGVGIAKTIGGIINSLDGVSERLEKIQKQARELGVRPLAVQAAGEISARAGQGPEVGTQAIAGMANLIKKARTETKGLDVDGVKTLRDMSDAAKETAGHIERIGNAAAGVRTFRGGQPPLFNLEDPLKTINVSLKGYKDTALDVEKQNKVILQGFLAFAKTVDPTSQKLNELSKALFQGVPAESMLRAAPKLLADMDKKIAELEQSARGATPVALSAVEQRNTARAVQAEMFTELAANISNWYIRLDAAQIEAQNRFITVTLPKWGADVKEWYNNFWPTLTADAQSSWATLNDALNRDFGMTFGEMMQSAMNSFSSAIDWMVNKASQLGSAVGKLFGSSNAGAATMPMPFAAGGSVPGSGHGDTVPAMLTPGEFVMRRAVVDALGAPFFAALNGGGGSLLPRSRFAMGGLVADSVSGGQPVHLHIGGHSFPLNGSANVVSALVVEAHRQHIRSAGAKPSWYGGR